MKVLWVTTRIFSDIEETESGVWLKTLAVKLSSYKTIELANISSKPGISQAIECNYGRIKQWVLPKERIDKNGYPSKKVRQEFDIIINTFKPDIIEIWGSENPFKLLPFCDSYSGIKVLTMQGVLSSMGPNCLIWFNLKELLYMFGLREILKRENIVKTALSFYVEGRFENEMIKKSNFVITQSDWTEAQISPVNPNVILFRTSRVLREPFLVCEKWHKFDHVKPILFTSAVGYSWKALHVFIRSLPIIARNFPNLEVRIAGKIGRMDFLGDGYLKLILKMIRENELTKNVIWLGALNAEETVNELQHACVYINPSNVESYSNTLAEAMSVGTPSVITFAGAMPERADHNKEALFFTPGDYKRCAYLIMKLLINRELAFSISRNAIKRFIKDNKRVDIVKNHFRIYKNILKISNLY